MSEETATILVFSDDKDRRHAAVSGIGLRASKDTPRIEWAEAATGFGACDTLDQQDLAMLILDAEAKKEGGVSIVQGLREIRNGVSPIVFLAARARDKWLVTWIGAAVTVADLIDPIILQETVADVLCGAK